ncbi:MAG: HAMP domain-containing sensor histidine kinase [Bdellovibrionota bacterium]
MKKFTDVLSPLSWLYFIVPLFINLVLFFRPSLEEFVLVILVDTIALVPAAIIELKLFRKLYPESALYFPTVDEQKLKSLSDAEVAGLLKSLMAYPERRARHFAIASIIKVLPAGLIIIFKWEHEVSRLEQALKFLAIEAVAFAYLYGAMYIEIHDFVSRKIADFHKKFNWQSAFHSLPIAKPKSEFFAQENVSLFSVMLLSVALLWVVVSPSSVQNSTQLRLEVLSVGVVGLALSGRIYYLNRKYFVGGLQQLFQTFESLDFGKNDFVIPLHSSSLLARFESTFNALSNRLRAREIELTQWVRYEAEQSRFRALGEISGLIAHDLAGPLHVIQFCTSELTQTNQGGEQGRFLQQLSTNTDRALELVTSLRAYLKNPDSKLQEASLVEAHRYVLQLLNTQYRRHGFNERMTFDLDPKLNDVVLGISRIDLVHILDNLYKNSVQNILDNAIPHGEIRVKLHRNDRSKLILWIQDNGTGLTTERFEEMTAPVLVSKNTAAPRAGLGLRLTRRLIERNEGRLEVVASDAGRGTVFLLTIGLPKQKFMNETQVTGGSGD